MRNDKPSTASRSSASTLSTYLATFSKAITAESTFVDKNEFLDIVYWLRQVFALIVGIIWGLLPLKGITAIILFFVINIGLIYFYAALFQRIDDDEYGGYVEVLKEGLMTTFGSFIVVWIVVYDFMHGVSAAV